MFDGLDAEIQVLLIDAADLVRWVDRVRPHLARMAEASGGRYETVDILAALASRRMLMWLVVEGADLECVFVTEIIQYPRLRAMRAVGVSGHRARRWMRLVADMERVSKEQFGCTKAEALHNPRHGVLLQTGGWRAFHVLSEKDL